MLEEVTNNALSVNEHDTGRQKELARSKPYVVFGIQPIDAVSWYYPHLFVQLSKKITKVLKFPK